MCDVLLEYWRRYYYVKRMLIVFVGAEDLDEFESWIVEIFGDMCDDGDEVIDLNIVYFLLYVNVVFICVLMV